MSIVGLIPARGGSRSIPKKNLASCAGKPLIQHTIEAGHRSESLEELYLSTDDAEIAGFARAHGVTVPWMRPEELAGDRTPMIDVIRHFLDWYRTEQAEPEGVMLLQPTSPLRTARHIDEAAARFLEHRPASLVSVIPVPHQFIPESLMVENEGRLEHYTGEGTYTRQEKPDYLARNGPAILVMSPRTIDRGESYGAPSIPYPMDPEESVDIDAPEDLRYAEWLLQNRDD